MPALGTSLHTDLVRSCYLTLVEDDLVLVAARGTVGQVFLELTLEEIDRLLAVLETAHYPISDLAEFFRDAGGFPRRAALDAAEAISAQADRLARLV